MEDPQARTVQVPGLGRWNMGGSSTTSDPHAHPHHVHDDKINNDRSREDGRGTPDGKRPKSIQPTAPGSESHNDDVVERRHKGILEKLGIDGVDGEIWRVARDPITGTKVGVRDQVAHRSDLRKLGLEGEDRTGLRKSNEEEAFKSMDKAEIMQPLGPELASWTSRLKPSSQSHEKEQSETAHLHLFPPLDWQSHHIIVNAQYMKMAVMILCGMLLVSFMPKSIYLVLPLSVVSLIYTKSLADTHIGNAKWDTDRQRGRSFAIHKSTPESVEWLNIVLEKIWPLINSELFVPIVDLLEDAMQAQIPTIVHGVQIADMSQGKNPIRVSFLRTLPETAADAKEQDSAHLAAGDSHEAPATESKRTSAKKYINVELAFVYRAKPRPSGSKAVIQDENMRLVVYLYIGLKNVVSVRVPVWVEMVGFTGTARARLELLSDPPFIGEATVSLMGLPRIEISATPLMRGLINVMNLPLISRYVLSCMNAVAAAFVAPRSYKLNLSKALIGDDVKKDCDALGILVVVIHSGSDLLASDVNSKSDPYVTLAWEQFGKPLYSTRIIIGDLEPVWEEVAFVLVHAATISADERICCTVWDSDRLTADDVLGLASVPIRDLCRQEGRIQIRDDQLEAFGKRGEKGQGKLKWSVGYFGKDPFPPSEGAAQSSSSVKNLQLPPDLQDFPGLKKKKSRLQTLMPDLQEHQVHAVGAHKDRPLGIVSIQIHQIEDLELIKTGGTLGKRQDGFEDADVGHIDEEGEKLPSSYCSIVLNGEKIYTTRIKPANSRPFFNTGTERSVRDWRSCSIMIIVRDSRLREQDPILGVVRLELGNQFRNVSQSTDWYPLRGGVAHGRMRVSLLFRSAGPSIPPSLRGWQIGIVQLGAKFVAEGLDSNDEGVKQLSINVKCAGVSSEFITRSSDIQEGAVTWRSGQLMIFPVRRRYTSNVVITIGKSSAIPGQSKCLGMAILQLRLLKDHERLTVTTPLWRTPDWERLKASSFQRQLFDHEDHVHCVFDPLPYSDNSSSDLSAKEAMISRLQLQQVGSLTFQIRFEPGLHDAHRDLAKSDPALGDAYEGWKCELLSHRRQEDEIGQSHKAHRSQLQADSRDAAAANQSEQPRRASVDEALPDDPETGSLESDSSSGDSSWKSLSSTYRARLDDESAHRKGLKGRWRAWKEDQRNLNRQHRGLMQSKKIRSVAWIGNSARHAATAMGNSFTYRERHPAVETEV